MTFRSILTGVGMSLIAAAGALRAQPVQTCTAQNIRGFPIEGILCGGSTHARNCSPGAIYRCKKGNQFDTNNCTLYQACATACITGSNSSTLNDSCFSGPKPLTLSNTSVLGGSEVTFTATVPSHNGSTIVNLRVN